jgi:hypothetical protein
MTFYERPQRLASKPRPPGPLLKIQTQLNNKSLSLITVEINKEGVKARS